MAFAPQFDPAAIPDLEGKVAIVTGGNVGIGFENVYYLASRNAKVYLAARSEERALAAIDQLQARLKQNGIDNKIYYHHLDLGTIKGAKASAEEFLKKEDRLDIVITNAGVLGIKWTVEYNYEPHMLVNHFSHFTFVNTLLPLIEETAAKTKDVRIVIVSSLGYIKAKRDIDFEEFSKKPVDLNEKRKLSDGYANFLLYCQSKLANVYYGRELDRRLREKHGDNNGIWVNIIHPGVVGTTGLGEELYDVVPNWLRGFMFFVMWIIALTPSQGAAAQTYAATSAEVPQNNVHGEILLPKMRLGIIYGGVGLRKLEPEYEKPEEWKKLWDYTEQVVAKELA